MKTPGLIVLALMMSATLIMAQTNAPAVSGTPMTIELRAPHGNTVKLGEAIPLIVALKNTSDERVEWQEISYYYKCGQRSDNDDKPHCFPHPAHYFQFIVQGPEGNLVPETDLEKDIHGKTNRPAKWDETYLTHGFRPKSRIDYHLNLADLFQITQPGTYTIQVQRRFMDDPNGALIKSNVLTVTVTQ